MVRDSLKRGFRGCQTRSPFVNSSLFYCFIFLPFCSAFATLKHDVRMIAVTEHRARALSEMLGATSNNSGIVHHQEKQGKFLCCFVFAWDFFVLHCDSDLITYGCILF